MSASNEYVQQFDYLCKAREKLFGWVRGQPAEVYARSFPFGMGSIRATLVHTDAPPSYDSPVRRELTCGAAGIVHTR